jgi:hypothetical protein
MNIFFDMDDTIIASDDSSLRPRVREVFERLRTDGHAVYIWSAMGKRWSEIDQHGLRELVTDAFHKPMNNFQRALKWKDIDVQPDFVVDDFPEILREFPGCTIKPYQMADPSDREMENVYLKIVEASRPQVGRAAP